MRIITENVFQIGDSGCSVYLIRNSGKYALIDIGMDFNQIKSIEKHGLSLHGVEYCILTHCHIDHIYALKGLKSYAPNIQLVAHELDAEAIETEGFEARTAASWYGVHYTPVPLNLKMSGELMELPFGSIVLKLIHIPGHTPGSIAVYSEVDGVRVLFGQDIHGPFMDEFESDLKAYKQSMNRLLDLEADILCEGHFGVIKPAKAVREFIESYRDRI